MIVNVALSSLTNPPATSAGIAVVKEHPTRRKSITDWVLIKNPNPGSFQAAHGCLSSTLRASYVDLILITKHFAANGGFTRLDGADFNVNGALAILLKINGLIELPEGDDGGVKRGI